MRRVHHAMHDAAREREQRSSGFLLLLWLLAARLGLAQQPSGYLAKRKPWSRQTPHRLVDPRGLACPSDCLGPLLIACLAALGAASTVASLVGCRAVELLLLWCRVRKLKLFGHTQHGFG